MHVRPQTGPLNPDLIRTPGNGAPQGIPPTGSGPLPDAVDTGVVETPIDDGTALIDNQIRTHDTIPLEHQDVRFPLSDGQNSGSESNALTEDLVSFFDAPDRVVVGERLNELATNLGFRDVDMMKHHVRNLSGEQKQTLLNGLRQIPADTPDFQAQVKQQFESTFHQSIDAIFSSQGLPTPSFRSEDNSLNILPENLWDTASLASVYNGLETIRQENPERLETLAQSGGIDPKTGKHEGLSFVRRHNPKLQNPDAYLQVLSDATRIAHADTHGGGVYIYDTAISGNHSEVTQHIVGKLDLLTRTSKDKNGNESLEPVYTARETSARGLDRREIETNNQYTQRLRETLTTEYVDRFGGWENLQKSLNFITRFRAIESNGQPKALVPETGANAKQTTINALGSLSGHLLRQIACRMEQQDGVQQLQSFLRDNAPPGTATSQLGVDGVIGSQTKGVVMSFQTGMALNTFKERIEDDPRLPETQKLALLEFLNNEFRVLADSPEQGNAIIDRVGSKMQELLSQNPLPVAEHTQLNLNRDLSNLGRLRTGNFDRVTAESLVNNWFNVMDSGQGNDLAEQLVVHELGHIWEQELDQETGLRVSENWSRLFDGTHTTNEFSTDQMNTNDFHEHLHRDQASASDYGSVNASEDFAEANRVFTYDPQRLMRRSLMKFLFVNALNNGQHNSDKVLEMAKECGYSEADVLERLNTVMGHGENGMHFTPMMAERMRGTYASLQTSLQQEPVSSLINFNISSVLNPLEMPSLRDVGLGSMYSNNAGIFANSDLPNSGTNNDWPRLDLDIPRLSQGVDRDRTAPNPDKSGWVMNAASERFKHLNDQLLSSQLNLSQRMNIYEGIKQLGEDLVNQGPMALNASPEAAEAVDQAISDKFCDGKPPTQADRQRGYAILAALSIYQATGSFNPGQHPTVSEHLPEAFHLMMAHPTMQQILSPENINQYNQSYLFEEVLDQVVATSSRNSAIEGSLQRVHNTSSVLSTKLSEVIGNEEGTYPSIASTQSRVDELMQNPDIQALFSDPANARFIKMALASTNMAASSLKGLTGIAIGNMSESGFQRMLLTAILMGTDKNRSDFSGFVGEYIQTPSSDHTG